VPIEIKINPLIGASTLGAAKKPPVKLACLLKVINRKCHMKRMHGSGGLHN
jgi:hypothetical protein